MNQRIIWILTGMLLLASSSCFAQQSKFFALFITKFSENVIWPETSDKIVIGVIGESDVHDHLLSFSTSKSNIEIIKIDQATQIPSCHMVYLPKAEEGKIEDFVSAIGGSSILLISENDKLVGKGSDIGFFLMDGKLRFVIAEASLKSKNLVVSNNLKSLGKTI